ncbi:hypothetical protein A0U93_09740 [Neoasaia chiangmaiensis]|uniref:Uncharacterized protein n=1 Tax=Neoasaia chiangmaiensis TaxID=320497 RepID=A0A1U9KQP5_9PROT|nr:hypothetical protein A0U93_09740 [Neoasaia chiangmaiensis]
MGLSSTAWFKGRHPASRPTSRGGRAHLTPSHIDDTISAEFWGRASDLFRPHHPALECLTIGVVVLKNGFTLVGTSACASPENFDAEIGRKIALQNAREQIWQLEGYHLRSRLHEETEQ